MIAAWMLYAFLWSVWLSAIASFAERVVVAGRGPVRAVWGAAMLGSIMLPVAMHFSPRRASSPAAMTDATVASAAAPVVTGGSPPLARVVQTERRRPAMAQMAVIGSRADGPLIATWIACSLGLLVYIAGGWVRLTMLRRTWRPRVVNGVHVLISDDAGPALVGVLRTAIVLPVWALALEPGALALMLRHELEHRAAGDTRLLAFAQALLVVMPWNPVSWWQLRRLRLAIELDCDARVLRRSGDVASYGRLLLALGQGPPMPSMSASLADHATNLEARIRGMTRRARLTSARAIAIASLSSVAAVAAACRVPAPSTTLPPPTEVNRLPSLASAADDSASRRSADSVAHRLAAADSVPGRAVASGGRYLERLARDSTHRQRAASIDSSGLSRLLEMLNVAVAAETARDPELRALHEQILDSYRYAVDSLVRAEKGLRQVYTSNHPAVIEARRKGAEAQGRLDSLLVQRQTAGARESGRGCTAGASVNGGAVVQRLVADDAAARAGRIIVSTETAQDNRLTVEAGGVTCSADAVGVIRVFGAVDDAPLVVRASRPASVVVVSRSGKVLAGPVAIPSATRRLALTWP